MKNNDQYYFEQPRSVIIISLFLMIISVITVIAWFLGQSNIDTQKLVAANPIPPWGQNMITLIGVICNMIAGMTMLFQKNWGRILYLFWGTTALLIGIFTSPNKLLLIPGGVAHTIIIYYLIREDIVDYFKEDQKK